MPDYPQLLYWDSCMFLSYLEGDPARLPTIEDILAEVSKSKGAIEIITSAVSITEVAYAAYEKTNGKLDLQVEAKIDEFWKDTSMFKLVDFHTGIARDARDLIRTALSKASGLKPNDAIHIVTAQRMGAYEFHTYDTRLFKYSSGVGFPICLPKPAQPTIFSALSE